MTIIVILIATCTSALVALIGSPVLAVLLPILTMGVFFIGEGIAVTDFYHRDLSHGVLRIKARWLQHFMLWFGRSGGAKVGEWVRNHIVHHEKVGTQWDPYTPKVTMISGVPAIRKPRLWWPRFDNTKAYYGASRWRDENPSFMEELIERSETVRRGLARLAEYEWAEAVYNRVWLARLIDGAVFAIVLLPLAIHLGWLWGTLAILVLTPVLVVLKIYLYLDAGYKVNWDGHRLAGLIDWVNVAIHRMIYSLWLLGEGWHEGHHDLPSARFHKYFDPGWWFAWVGIKFGWIDRVYVSVPKPDGGPREYIRVRYDKPAADEVENELVAA